MSVVWKSSASVFASAFVPPRLTIACHGFRYG